MRIAIIDLGTNSVRFDVHQLGPKNNVRVLYREKVMVRLGQGVFVKGQLDQDAILRTSHAFLAFKRISDEFSVSRVIALGTSALREATDAAKLVELMRKTTGIDVRVISGLEEAKLIALGVLSNEKIPRGRVALVDIGGGSTEISVTRNKKVLHCGSFPLGTARLQQVFLKGSPPSEESVVELRHYIRKNLSAEITDKNWPKVSEVIGSSGTIKALARIGRKSTGKKHLSDKDLRLLVKKMGRMTTTQLLGFPGMEAKRVDMILAGAVLLDECMTALGAKRVVPTEYALRDGILREQIELANIHMRSRIALHLPDLVEKAKRLGGNEANLKAVRENARILFQRLGGLHKLDRNWSLYLEAAAVLRNTGEAISLVGHPEHTYYIVKNAKFPFIESWESELVAQLCRYHEHHKLDFKTLPFEGQRTRRRVFLKLLGLLCVVDALDAVPDASVAIKRVATGKGYVQISCSGGSLTDLETFRIENREELFEGIFGKRLVLRRV